MISIKAIKRIAIPVVGSTVLVIGVALLVLPGPSLHRHSSRTGDPRGRIRVGAAVAAQSPRISSEHERRGRLLLTPSATPQKFPRVGVCTHTRTPGNRQNKRTKR